MMVNDVSIIGLAFANLLDLIPMISNTDEDVDPALIRLYERNAAIVNEEWDILLNENLFKLGSKIPPGKLKKKFPNSNLSCFFLSKKSNCLKSYRISSYCLQIKSNFEPGMTLCPPKLSHLQRKKVGQNGFFCFWLFTFFYWLRPKIRISL